MKKVRIMLSAVLALAIVGGALAFKAKTDQAFCFYSASQEGKCSVFQKFITQRTTVTELAGDYNTIETLLNVTDPCPAANTLDCTERLTTIVE